MNRVVVTGMGALTPVGNSVKEYLENIKKGVNGIDMITHFDVSESKHKFAGEVKNADLAGVIDNKEDRTVGYTVDAALVNEETLNAFKKDISEIGIRRPILSEDPFRDLLHNDN